MLIFLRDSVNCRHRQAFHGTSREHIIRSAEARASRTIRDRTLQIAETKTAPSRRSIRYNHVHESATGNMPIHHEPVIRTGQLRADQSLEWALM
jgi:hypothetical protein